MLIPNDKSLSGSMVFIKGELTMSQQIMFHMMILAWHIKHKVVRYSHAETLIWSERRQTLFTVGARKEGVAISTVEEYYTEKMNILVRQPNVLLTPNDNLKLWGYWSTVKGHEYQVFNFLSWITYLKTGIWLAKDSDEKLYCYELDSRFSKVIGLWPKGKSNECVSIFDLVDNMAYHDIPKDELDLRMKLVNAKLAQRDYDDVEN